MKPILKTYTWLAAAAASLAVILNTIVIKFISPWAHTKFASSPQYGEFIIFLLSLSIYYSIAFAFPIFFYKSWLWRIIHRRIAFCGYWKVTITYIECEKGCEYLPADFSLPYLFDTYLEIQQDTFSIDITSASYTDPEGLWRVLIVEVIDEELRYVYEGERAVQKPYPFAPNTLGFDRVQVIERYRFGTPRKCKGVFYQCCLPGNPLYRGTTLWSRITRREYHDKCGTKREQFQQTRELIR